MAVLPTAKSVFRNSTNTAVNMFSGGAGGTEALTRMLETLENVGGLSGKKEIEVRVERSEFASIVKIQLEQITNLSAKYNEIRSERDSLLQNLDASMKECSTRCDTQASLEEELKSTKAFLTDTRVELERIKTHFDLLERKYVDLVKKKQEVKIINKETIKEVIVEVP